MHDFPKKLRQENIDEGVLSMQERLVFEAMSLVDYEKHRAQRGLPPLTKLQREGLLSERIALAIFAENTFTRQPEREGKLKSV